MTDGTDWITTVSGERFPLSAPEARHVRLTDIAHALSMQCRYGGHVQPFYSVAEHAVLVSDWVHRTTGDPRLALAGLHHDDAEAYLTDLPRPVKRLLPGYLALEERIETVIAARLGLIYPWPKIVNEADSRILSDERLQAGGSGTGALRPLGVRLMFLDPECAKSSFLDRHARLMRAVRCSGATRRELDEAQDAPRSAR